MKSAEIPHDDAPAAAARAPVTLADFRARAALRLAQDPETRFDGPPDGDHQLNGDALPPAAKPLKDAAVLVGLVPRGGEADVILTVRTAHLASHAGQVAFPGGKIDPTDPTAAAAALREAREEIGLPPHCVEPLGYAPPYHTRSGFRIFPVVGLVEPGFVADPNPNEVADVFTVPLGVLMDPACHRVNFREAPTGKRYFYEIPFAGYYIWGVTAGMIRRLYERLYL